jgi:hypothetical protein
MSGLSKSEQKEIITELGSAYLFNVLYIADQEDEGGLDAPLEKKYACLQPLIDELESKKLIKTEEYEEDGEEGEEYIPSRKGQSFIEKLNENCDKYLQKNYGDDELENMRKAFYDAMSEGSISKIDESDAPWYEVVTAIEFYENLIPDAADEPVAEEEEDSYSAPVPRAYREDSGESAFDVSEPNQVQAEDSTRRYLKPAIIHAFIAIFFSLFALFGSPFMWIVVALFLGFAAYYIMYTVSIKDDQIISKNWFDTRRINISEIGETTFEETDDNNDRFEVIGGNGVSIEVSSWIEDFSGFRYYITRLASEEY